MVDMKESETLIYVLAIHRQALKGIILDKVSHWDEFDYVIVNVSLQETVTKIQKIISGERMRRVRQVGLKGFVKELVKEAEES